MKKITQLLLSAKIKESFDFVAVLFRSNYTPPKFLKSGRAYEQNEPVAHVLDLTGITSPVLAIKLIRLNRALRVPPRCLFLVFDNGVFIHTLLQYNKSLFIKEIFEIAESGEYIATAQKRKTEIKVHKWSNHLSHY